MDLLDVSGGIGEAAHLGGVHPAEERVKCLHPPSVVEEAEREERHHREHDRHDDKVAVGQAPGLAVDAYDVGFDKVGGNEREKDAGEGRDRGEKRQGKPFAAADPFLHVDDGLGDLEELAHPFHPEEQGRCASEDDEEHIN